ncbi:MAG TPA: MaoC family dehydratase [Rhizomicrobium sp.]|nr:MaoC family dehydratase [Rhizomicrobium sp.]
MDTPRYFEDFRVGQKFAFGAYEVTKEEIIAFAREFDPQPHHLDEDAAKNSLLGGLAASGWQVCAIAMRLATDHIFNQAQARGGAGVEDCRWLKPVRPGDMLRLEVEVLATRPHPRRPLGFVTMRWDVFNQREQVASIVNTPIFARRSAA